MNLPNKVERTAMVHLDGHCIWPFKWPNGVGMSLCFLCLYVLYSAKVAVKYFSRRNTHSVGVRFSIFEGQ
jgi:hypothetical protein